MARAILDEEDLALSVQILGEFFVQATRASRSDALTHEQAERLVESFTRFRVGGLTLEVVRAALGIHSRFGVSYWDSLVLESARSLRCETVISEDMSAEQDYAGVRVENPFES